MIPINTSLCNSTFNSTLIFINYDGYILEYKDFVGIKSWNLEDEELELKQNKGCLAYYSKKYKKYFFRSKMQRLNMTLIINSKS